MMVENGTSLCLRIIKRAVVDETVDEVALHVGDAEKRRRALLSKNRNTLIILKRP